MVDRTLTDLHSLAFYAGEATHIAVNTEKSRNQNMPAQNDTFNILESYNGNGFGGYLEGNVFNDNGQGADGPGTITHVNGVALTPDTSDFVYIGSSSTAELFIGTGGSTFPALVPGEFHFFFGHHYDYLTAGQTAAVSFTYSISDGTTSSTATATINITGIDSDDLFNGTDTGETISAGVGDDTVLALGGNDWVYGETGDDKLNGGAGSDWVYGGTGNDKLDGAVGNDKLFGEDGTDELTGGAGNDVLYGGKGQDSLIGGAGRDLFKYTTVKESSRGHFDAIQDLRRAQHDHIDLKLIDANTHLKGNQAFTFIGAGSFSHTAGELRYENLGNVVLAQGDFNGDGRADIEILVNKLTFMKASDFIL